MAIKKKQTLRSKAASRLAAAKQSSDSRASLSKFQKPSTLQKEANPFLHQLKITKKERQNDKSQGFLEKLSTKMSSSNMTNGLSKSALRRQKRKLKSKLKSDIGGLLDVLPEAPETNTTVDTSNAFAGNSSNPFASSYIPPTKPLNHLPNPHTSLKGARKVEKLERERFGLIMTDKSYQASPFEALKDTIKANMEKFQ